MDAQCLASLLTHFWSLEKLATDPCLKTVRRSGRVHGSFLAWQLRHRGRVSSPGGVSRGLGGASRTHGLGRGRGRCKGATAGAKLTFDVLLCLKSALGLRGRRLNVEGRTFALEARVFDGGHRCLARPCRGPRQVRMLPRRWPLLAMHCIGGVCPGRRRAPSDGAGRGRPRWVLFFINRLAVAVLACDGRDLVGIRVRQ